MIKTIIFDLGGVYFTDGTQKTIKIISERFAIPIKQAAFVFTGDPGRSYRTGKITTNEFWDAAKKLWGIEIENNDLNRIWLESYTPIAAIVKLIEKLNKAKYELLFLSDNTEERVCYLEKRYKFLRHFKDGVFSHIVKAKKPEPEMYEAVFRRTKSKPHECLFIDNKKEYLHPAEAFGMKTIHFRDVQQLEDDLKTFEIAV